MSLARAARQRRTARGETPFDGGQSRLPFEVVAGTAANTRLPAGPQRLAKPSVPGDSAWRAVDQEVGDLWVVCPSCWPDVARQMRGRSGMRVRVFGPRPAWAHCSVCDPEAVR